MKRKQNWILYFLLLLLSFFLVCSYGGTISYLLFYSVLSIPLLGFVYVLYVKNKFKLYQYVEGRDFVKGDPVDYIFRIGNEDVIYYDNIEVKFDSEYATILGMKKNMTFHLRPGEQKEVKTKIICNYRGKYEIGIKDYYVSDFLNLYRLHGQLTSSVSLIIKPRIVPWKMDSVWEEKSQGSRAREVRTNGELGNAIRSYVPGDSIRSVHWKASAKAGELKVREMEKNCGNGFLIVLDCTSGEETGAKRLAREDALIEKMVALAYECYKRNIPVRVLYWESGIKCYEISDLGTWNAFYRLSGMIEFQSPYPVENLEIPIRELKRSRQIVYITDHKSTALNKKTEELQRAGIQVFVAMGE